VAFVVQDEYQGRGAGTILLAHLAHVARALGYHTLEAEVLPDNQRMLDVFAHSGLTLRERRSEGLVHVEMDL
jgi:GNAT superfamily N-acetyltransferase